MIYPLASLTCFVGILCFLYGVMSGLTYPYQKGRQYLTYGLTAIIMSVLVLIGNALHDLIAMWSK